MLGGIVAIGASNVAPTAASAAAPATPTNPPTTPPPPPTTPPPPPQTPPTPAPTTTTIPYRTTVEQDCAAYQGDPDLAKRLDAAKGNDGSTHLVLLAEFCGVQFSDEAEPDPDLDRPWSNLEYAVRDEDDPYFTNAYDAVTANPAQAEIVEKTSTDAWYAAHPELVPKTTAPPTTEPSTTTATTAASTTTDAAPSTTEPDEDEDEDDETDDADSQTGNSLWQIVGVLMLGVGAVVVGVSSVRRGPGD